MSDDFLKIKLLRVIRRYQWLAFWRKLAATWAAAALLGVIVVALQRQLGWSSPHVMPWFAAIAVAFALGLTIRHFQGAPDYRWVARRIEKAHPELNGVLLTAVQQGLMPGAEPSFLQYRVMQEATARSQEQDWRQVFPTKRFVAMQGVHLFALACFIYVLGGMRGNFVGGTVSKEGGNWVSADGMSVSPGDTSIEKGDSLVVLARFQKSLPPTVSMVVRENGVATRTVPLVKSLADPVFGGSVPEVATDLTYHLEYRGQRTRDFKVTVFEHPKLVRADVDLTFPGYTKLPVKHIEDTRRVSAVEGTKLDYALQLNKPVKSAQLVARDAKKTAIPLRTDPAKAVATLPAFVPAASGTYDLQLVDADGRANKVASTFVIDVQPNRPPEIRLNAPRGDQRPSALEEVTFDGTVWDDFGVPSYGLAYSLPGQETKFIELGRDAGAKEKKPFNTILKLEELGAKPDDLIAWYVWADDIGPDGKVRRTQGDLYFAEVRPFDEVFRESQDMQQQDSQGQQAGQGNQRRRLTEMQKQVINATWRLQRDGAKPKYADDAKVVLDAQTQVKQQADEAAGEARTPREQALWKDATDQMDKALDRLKAASTAPGPLAQAVPAEQAAYQALLKLQARETNVTRSRNARGGGGGGGNQRQIDQLDLKQAENRYETQRQAQAPKNQERLEQLAVMNRLQELARRQQDLNDRLKELQTALQEAKTDEEREEARKRLKRLEEEQRQMLADADEIRQRMDRTENQSSMSDQRQQLDQTREDIQKAADAASQGSVAQALAAGTRAQRQLQQMRDDMRKENSSQFADDLREMRAEARDLANKQEEIGQKLDALSGGAQRKSLSDSGDRQELLDQLGAQKDRMEKLVDRAQQVSEQAENTEPLISKSLYDSIRKLNQQDDTSVKQAKQELANSGMMTNNLAERLQQAQDREGSGKAIDLTRDILREGFVPQASQANQRARAGVDELKRGVERAAESVLGDDAEQLKLAQSELDQLTDALQREMNQAQQGSQSGAQQSGQRGDQRAAQNGAQGGQRQAGQQGQQPGDRPGEQQGLAQNQSGNQRGQQSGQQQGQQAQDGQAQASTDGQQPGGAPPQGGQQPGSQQRGGGSLANARNQPDDRRGNFSVDDVLNNRDAGGGGDGGALRDGAWNGGDWGRGGVLTGDAFNRWQERLRDVETLLDAPDLRNRVAVAIERANILRREYRNDAKKPDWAVVQLQVLKPLVEVRERVAEDLARRDSKDSLAPIDRDPVPARYAESVRKYYEELGKDKPTEAVR